MKGASAGHFPSSGRGGGPAESNSSSGSGARRDRVGGHAFLLESAGPVAASVLRFLRSIEGGDGGGPIP